VLHFDLECRIYRPHHYEACKDCPVAGLAAQAIQAEFQQAIAESGATLTYISIRCGVWPGRTTQLQPPLPRYGNPISMRSSIRFDGPKNILDSSQAAQSVDYPGVTASQTLFPPTLSVCCWVAAASTTRFLIVLVWRAWIFLIIRGFILVAVIVSINHFYDYLVNR